LVTNPSLIPAGQGRGANSYLIFVAQALQSDIAAFVAAKTDQGFAVNTQVVAPGATTAQIKSYIQSLWGGPDAPAYVLLVGDTNLIPYWVGVGVDNPDSDLYYVCMDGTSDWYPDIAIGRFPVRTATQLNAVVNKTLYYETGPLADPGYLNRAVFMASSDNYQVSEGTHNWVINNYMTPKGVASDKRYCHTYNATTQQVRDSFNGGRIFGIYSGHGSETSWADGPVFSQSDITGLTNANMYAFVASFACLTGRFSVDECFMETWLRSANKGAITALGSSVYSYWTEDDILERKLFDSIYDQGDSVVSRVGPVINDAKLRYLAYFGAGGSTRRYFEMYNIMGDPALPFGGPEAPVHGMYVTPSSGLASQGPRHGPFTPASVSYTITNQNSDPLEYQVSNTQPWVSVTNPAGTLGAKGSVIVTVSLNTSANYLPNGNYVDTVTFTNLTDHDGDAVRSVTLQIGTPSVQYNYPLDTNPGWAVQGQWAFGHPTGQGGTYYGAPDPTNGATGANVYGVNLNGDYSLVPGGPYYLTLGPVNLASVSQTSLKFMRWLNSDFVTYVGNTIDVSKDGTTWVNVWTNNSTPMWENAWSLQSYDLSATADNQPAVYVRWGYRVYQYAWACSGWNLDDVQIWGLSGYPLGDLNCDGAVNGFDIDPFVLTLSGAPTFQAYYAQYPNCDHTLADINLDGAVNAFDIDPFVAMLIGG
jgi:hypothetical protein